MTGAVTPSGLDLTTVTVVEVQAVLAKLGREERLAALCRALGMELFNTLPAHQHEAVLALFAENARGVVRVLERHAMGMRQPAPDA